MKNRMIVVCILFLVLLPGARTHSSAAQTQTKPLTCCYVNTQYHGVCQITPAEGETCDSILKYLNTPGTAGKNYCNQTAIRGGWKQVACTSNHST